MKFLKEDYNDETVELVYNDLYVEASRRTAIDDYDTVGARIDYTLEIDHSDICDDLYEILTAEGMDLDNLPYDYIEENFDDLVDKYYDKLLDIYEEKAQEKAEEEYSYEDLEYDNSDDEYERIRDLFGEDL